MGKRIGIVKTENLDTVLAQIKEEALRLKESEKMAEIAKQEEKERQSGSVKRAKLLQEESLQITANKENQTNIYDKDHNGLDDRFEDQDGDGISKFDDPDDTKNNNVKSNNKHETLLDKIQIAATQSSAQVIPISDIDKETQEHEDDQLTHDNDDWYEAEEA